MKINKKDFMIGFLVCTVFVMIAAGMSKKQWQYLLPGGYMWFRTEQYMKGDSTNYAIEISSDIYIANSAATISYNESNFEIDLGTRANVGSYFGIPRISSGSVPNAVGDIGWDYVDSVATVYLATSTEAMGWKAQ